MQVQCPNCQTIYKVSDTAVKGSNVTFRCSRCKHTFARSSETSSASGAESGASSHSAPPESPRDRELSFTFPPREEEGSQNRDESPEPSAEPPVVEDSALPAGPEGNDEWFINSTWPSKQPGFTLTGPESPREIQKADDDAENRQPKEEWLPPSSRDGADKVLPIDPYREHHVSTLPYLTLFGLLVISFSLITALAQIHPAALEGFLKNVPWLGSSVLKNDHLTNGVAVQSLRSGFQTILGNRDVFVVTGAALNENPVAVREIRVLGKLYGEDGNELDQQMIWVGNAISPKIVRGMTPQDISDLQRLKPLRSFEIPPGDSVPFAIVFLKPSKGIKEFSCQVLSAESEA